MDISATPALLERLTDLAARWTPRAPADAAGGEGQPALDLVALARVLGACATVCRGRDRALLAGDLERLVGGLERLESLRACGGADRHLDTAEAQLGIMARDMAARAHRALEAEVEDLDTMTALTARVADADAPDIDVSRAFAVLPSPQEERTHGTEIATVFEPGSPRVAGWIEGMHGAVLLKDPSQHAPLGSVLLPMGCSLALPEGTTMDIHTDLFGMDSPRCHTSPGSFRVHAGKDGAVMHGPALVSSLPNGECVPKGLWSNRRIFTRSFFWGVSLYLFGWNLLEVSLDRALFSLLPAALISGALIMITWFLARKIFTTEKNLRMFGTDKYANLLSFWRMRKKKRFFLSMDKVEVYRDEDVSVLRPLPALPAPVRGMEPQVAGPLTYVAGRLGQHHHGGAATPKTLRPSIHEAST